MRPSDAELSEQSIQGGIACELVQTGSLYHDDVMDEADTRRGVETVNAKWGNLQAILAGDFLLSRASGIAASLGTEVAGLLARTIGRLCEGQIEELRHTYNSARPEASYMASISGKTASLYATAARIGGLVAGFDRVASSTRSPSTARRTGWCSRSSTISSTSPRPRSSWASPPATTWSRACTPCRCMRTLQAGGVPAMELLALLGKPLDTAEREKALAIVRDNGGVASAFATARTWADSAPQ